MAVTAVSNRKYQKQKPTKLSVGAKIHNRFDFYINDKPVAYGESEYQVGMAENIVLDQMYTRLCARSSYFVNIHFGTGTGTLSAARTSLFSHLGTKTAVNDAQIKALPTSWWRRKIVLNPEEYVGSALSEVGVAYSSTSTNLVTHALIKDINGNPITLTKTAMDVVTIYATVYVTFSTSNANLKICSMASNENPLVNYLIGGTTFPTLQFTTGQGAKTVDQNTRGTMSEVVFTTANLTLTSNTANKKFYTNTQRIAGESNNHLTEIALGSSNAGIFNLRLPASGIYSGLSLSGVSVGTGDGTTTKFTLPSRNIYQSSIVAKVDGVTTSVTKTEVKLDMDAKIKNPANLPPNTGRGCALTPDGLVLAVAHVSLPYITTYDWSGGAWVKRANPANLPPNTGYGCALTPNGLVLAVAHFNSPYITTYDWSGGAWIKRADPANLPTGTGYGCALTPDGLVLAVAHEVSPYITTYDWSGGAWVKRANPANLPPNTGYGCALTPDGLVLAVAHFNSPYITTYDWSGGAWVKRADPANLLTGTGYGCALTTDGLVLAVAHEFSPGIATYDLSSMSTQITFSTPPGLVTSEAVGTGDGSTTIFNLDHTPIAGSLTMKLGGVKTTDYTANGAQITFNTTPGSGVAITADYRYECTITADYTVNGIHKTNQRVIDLYAEITFGEVT